MGRRPPERKPAFSKILVKDFSKKLMIPSKFVRLHRGTLARKCVLRPTGTQDAWCVKTKQINDSLYFKKGWKKFARHYSLGFGDLLVFRYAQDCEFYVDMFDQSCCLKELAVTSHNVESRKQTNSGREEALDKAEKLMSSSKFPAFLKIMQWAYVRPGGYLPLTTDFARKYFKDSTREVKIEVSGKTWTAGVRKDCSTYRLTRCWSYLVTEQALEVGDVCVFELINTEDYTLKLTIFSSTRKNKICKTKARPFRAFKARSCQASKKRSSHALEAQSRKAIKAANRFSSLSKYPSSPYVMRHTYLRARYLHVPAAFVKQMNVSLGANKVKLQCRGKEWDAFLHTYGFPHRDESRIVSGWSAFVEENSLQIGDACVLELIDREAAVIRVTIFECTN
ncbi:hypothetical protein ACET3Z_021726 [Daucus carota]